MGPRLLGREGFFHEGQEVEVLLALAVGRLEDRVVESGVRLRREGAQARRVVLRQLGEDVDEPVDAQSS